VKQSRQKPLLSVVMPVHDGADWIAETLRSVADEPVDELEILVIDSSDEDRTASIVMSFADQLPLTLLRRPDVKPWQTKTNIGVQLASAEHVCILHQDDLWLSGRVTAIRRWIARHPNSALHLAPSRFVDCEGRAIGKWTCPLPPEQPLSWEVVLKRLLVQNFISVPAPVFRRGAWIDCGGMDEKLWYTPDWDTWIKLSEAGEVIYHNNLTTAFRIHRSSLTITGSRDLEEFQAQMETVLERHLNQLPREDRRRVERLGRTSIEVNVALAAASGSNRMALFKAMAAILSLGPLATWRYLSASRLAERVISRLRARVMGVPRS
jgi:glycosyltransferase involved in cell wall biosynthesis